MLMQATLLKVSGSFKKEGKVEEKEAGIITKESKGSLRETREVGVVNIYIYHSYI